VAVDNSRMYYAILQSSQIWAANLDGTNPQPIVNPGEPEAGQGCDMAIYSGTIYLTRISGGSAAAIYQIPIPASAGPPAIASPQILQAAGAYLAVGPQ
jgi:hypothetical protein